MNPYSSHLFYKNVFAGAKAATGYSQVISAADFNNIQFTLFPALTATIGTVVGTFQIGETVTGGSSGATGVISAFTATTITLTTVTGTFTNAETITGVTSAAHAAISAISTPNFTIVAYKSNQKPINGVDNPPDPTLPMTPTNDYERVMYTGERGGVNYDGDDPYNPNTGSSTGTLSYSPQSFLFQTQGARWVFLRVDVFTGGSLSDADINLFNQ